MTARPTTRPPSVAEVPVGLRYVPGFLEADEHDRLWRLFEGWHFDDLRFRGQCAKRSARHFGASYDLERRSTGPAPPLPPELEPLRHRAGEVASLPARSFGEALVLRYPEGAGIGWHRDAPAFGSPVVGVSLGAPCVLRFQRRRPEVRLVHAVELEPGSAYVLDGPARWSWQHAITATPGRRYSITFRIVRGGPDGGGDAAHAVERCPAPSMSYDPGAAGRPPARPVAAVDRRSVSEGDGTRGDGATTP